MVMQAPKLKLWVGFAAPSHVITNLTYVEDFVKVLRATKMGSCLRCNPEMVIIGPILDNLLAYDTIL